MSPSSIAGNEKWPSELMRLISQDATWDAVLERLSQHPQEVLYHNGGRGTCLHAACVRYPPLHIVQAICDAVPESMYRQNMDGETALHRATSCGASDDVQLELIQRAPCALLKVDRYGESPLFLAARAMATLPVLQAMVQASPPWCITTRNLKGQTPLLVLNCSYVKATSLHELQHNDEYDQDWRALVLLLRAACPEEEGLLHAAAKTPETPREFWHVVGRLFEKQQAMVTNTEGKTPLALMAQAPLVQDPERDCFRKDYQDEIKEQGPAPPLQVQASLPSYSRHLQETLLQNDSCTSDENVGCLHMLVQWNPLAARVPDNQGRLPLAHALVSGKSWQSGVQHLVWAAPQALQQKDKPSGLYPFQLAAVCNAPLDTIYNLTRSFPEHVRVSNITTSTPQQDERNGICQGCVNSGSP